MQATYGVRPHRLTKNEIPALTRAILAFQRRQASVGKYVLQGTACIRIYNEAGINVMVRADDWAKIVPYLRDGTFNPNVVPVPSPSVMHPNQYRDVSVLDQNEPELYLRIYAVLLRLFPIEFPVSNL